MVVRADDAWKGMETEQMCPCTVFAAAESANTVVAVTVVVAGLGRAETRSLHCHTPYVH